jgi:hypothetical protein
MARRNVAAFVTGMKRAMRVGHIAPETEHHLRYEFSRIGWDRDEALHAAKVDEEIARLELEATMLRRLRNDIFPAAEAPQPAAAAAD